MRSPHHFSAFFLVLFLLVASFLEIPKHQAQLVRESALAAVLSSSATTTLDTRTKTENCEVRGALQDPKCSPGAVFPDATPDIVCVKGYSKTVRSVSDKIHRQVFAEYNISFPQPHGSYEVDHIIPLAIGGSNDIANLYPEAKDPPPGFREKDVVEVFLQEQVCSGQADLRAAQSAIAHDWLSIYKNIAPSDISRIKAKYKSWSN